MLHYFPTYIHSQIMTATGRGMLIIIYTTRNNVQKMKITTTTIA